MTIPTAIPDNWLSELRADGKLRAELQNARVMFQAAGVAVIVKPRRQRSMTYAVEILLAVIDGDELNATSCLWVTVSERRLARALSHYQQCAQELAARRLEGFSVRAGERSPWLVAPDGADALRLSEFTSQRRPWGWGAAKFTRRLRALAGVDALSDTALLAAWQAHGHDRREQLLAVHTVATHPQLPLDDAFALAERASSHLRTHPGCAFSNAPAAA